MLRITADDKPRVVTFQLEGRLEGPWVRELERCSRDLPASGISPTLRVDLTGVTFVDDAGKAQLAAMQQAGAQFIAGDCLTAAIVAEIGGESLSPAAMTEQLAQLRRLGKQLHGLNDALTSAAKPLERLSNLDGARQKRVAAEIQAALARWQELSRQISRVLGNRNGDALR